MEMKGNDENALSTLLRKAVEGDETALEVSRQMIGEGDEAKPVTTFIVTRRKVNPEPPALAVLDRSPRRQHEFFDVAGLAGAVAGGQESGTW